MAVACGAESWRQCWQELRPLWEAEHAEVGQDRDAIAADVDVDLYAALWDAQQLCVIVARNDEGAAVGYHISIIRTHQHYRALLCAFVDMLYVLPEYRSGTGAGDALQDAAVSLWRAGGVRKAFSAAPTAGRLGAWYTRHGWNETETHYSKTLTE